MFEHYPLWEEHPGEGDLMASIGGSIDEASLEGGEEGEGLPAAPAAAPAATPAAAPSPRSAPSSWAKEMHEHYSKLDPKIQDYVDLREKQMLEGLSQYKELADFGKMLKPVLDSFLPDIQQMGVDPARAVQILMNAHRVLSRGTPEQKVQMFQRIAQDYGVEVAKLTASAAAAAPGSEVDPTLKPVLDRLNKVEGALTAAQRAQLSARYNEAMAEVDEFAKDPAHPYFDEVAEQVMLLLQNPKTSLKDAYEQAVWANPVTRAKEMQRLEQETKEKLKKEAEEKAAAARKARGTPIRGSDTDRAPTGPLGSIDDTLDETLAAIKSRTS